VLKLLGSLLISGAGVAALVRELRAQRNAYTQLCALRSALESMGDAIRLERVPLPRLLARTGATCGRSVRWFFSAVAGALEQDVPLPAAWRRSAGAWSPEIRRILDELGEKLCGDEEQACKGIQLACNSLTRIIEDTESHRREREQRSAAVCLSAAALLIILLI
jgi:stage III sporulation protein AB